MAVGKSNFQQYMANKSKKQSKPETNSKYGGADKKAKGIATALAVSPKGAGNVVSNTKSSGSFTYPK